MNLIDIISDKGFWVIFVVSFFLGLFLGWFYKKGSIFWIIIALFIFRPIIEFLIRVDYWIFTVPYFLGFLVHTAKPLWKRIKS